MFEDDAIKKLEARLTRLEATVAQHPSGATGAVPNIGAIADPVPWPWGGGGWGGWGGGRPGPIVDPAAYASLYRGIVDPAPWWGGRPPWGPIPDPAVFAGAVPSQASFARFGPVGDPPPIDVSRFSIAQLEAALHSINAEKARLTSMEALVKGQLDRLKEQR
jgi:hypothetical protein